MHDIVKTLQSVKENLWSDARGWEKGLRKHGKITMKCRVTRPLQHVVTINVEDSTLIVTTCCKGRVALHFIVIFPCFLKLGVLALH